MYLQRITIGIAAATLVAGSTVAFAASSEVKKALGKMACGEILTIEDRFQPKVIYCAVPTTRGIRSKVPASISRLW